MLAGILVCVAAQPSARGLLRRWEDAPAAVQVGLVGPVVIGLLWWAHVALLNQPAGRGLSYGIFWGALATGAIVAATRSEGARRRAREAGERRERG